MSNNVEISIIIPCLNEIAALPETLQQLQQQQAQNFEIIIVDGGSADGTWEYLEDLNHVHLQAARGRASQMNAGAAMARGKWLLFLHADTLLPDNATATVASQPETIKAGGFRQRFNIKDWRLELISWMDNLRCRITHVVYGDQALFIRRALFEKIGGYPPISELEDLRFGETLRKHTQPVLLPDEAVTDARKFVQMGIWRSFGRLFLILICAEFKLPILGRAFFQNIR